MATRDVREKSKKKRYRRVAQKITFIRFSPWAGFCFFENSFLIASRSGWWNDFADTLDIWPKMSSLWILNICKLRTKSLQQRWVCRFSSSPAVDFVLKQSFELAHLQSRNSAQYIINIYLFRRKKCELCIFVVTSRHIHSADDETLETEKPVPPKKSYMNFYTAHISYTSRSISVDTRWRS